jgi:hypothetical protein
MPDAVVERDGAVLVITMNRPRPRAFAEKRTPVYHRR